MHRVDVVVLELGHDGHRSKRIEADEQLHRLGDVDRNVSSTRIVRVQEVQADTWRPMTMSMCSTGLSRETLLLPSVMLNMVIARAGACWRPPFDDLVQDVAPA